MTYATRNLINGRFYSTQTLEERFWSKVDKKSDDECWEWTASTSWGYGQLWFGNSFIKAHRFSYEIVYGEIPDGLFVCHKCDNTRCVNPNHLFLGTCQDNMNDMKSKGRSSNQKGMNNGCVKLSDDDVLEIRKLAKEGTLLQKDIAKRFGITRHTVRRIVKRELWKHI